TVTINWGVQTEANINNYSIEQSNDGSNFAQIKTQTPTANNGGNANYSIIDATASKAANWYRVKYTNITGNIKYTSIAMVNAVATNFASNLSEIKIYDNPITNGKLNIFFNNQPEGKYNIKIFNSIGQQIISNNVNISNSNFLYNINLSNHLLSSGNYNVVITPSTGLKSSLKFIVP
ncbi:MAG: T9SS type A sorting domain-containing protein, partial [Ferruginibacter sp.]|nr:T9SS type A sorting domain-containing protein [Ferruginibacter sp.]